MVQFLSLLEVLWSCLIKLTFPRHPELSCFFSRYIWVCPWPWRQGAQHGHYSPVLVVPTPAPLPIWLLHSHTHSKAVGCEEPACTANSSHPQLLITPPPLKVILTTVQKATTVNRVDAALSSLVSPRSRLLFLMYITYEAYFHFTSCLLTITDILCCLVSHMDITQDIYSLVVIIKRNFMNNSYLIIATIYWVFTMCQTLLYVNICEPLSEGVIYLRWVKKHSRV